MAGEPHGWQVVVRQTEAAGHAMELAHLAAAGRPRSGAGGRRRRHAGEVANGLAHTDTIMAPLPVGTANSLPVNCNCRCPRPGSRTGCCWRL
jgi:diacylglycerol kinase (ATP)